MNNMVTLFMNFVNKMIHYLRKTPAATALITMQHNCMLVDEIITHLSCSCIMCFSMFLRHYIKQRINKQKGSQSPGVKYNTWPFITEKSPA